MDPSTTATDIPQKTPRRNDDEDDDDIDDDLVDNAGLPINVDPASRVLHVKCDKRNDAKKFTGDEVIRSCDARDFAASSKKISKRLQERQEERGDWQDKTQTENDVFIASLKRKKQEQEASTRRLVLSSGNVKDESTRLRKTIQWLEEGARRLREDLANARTELHEERRAAKLVKREIEAAIREAKATEAAKYQLIISELKSRLSRSGSAESNCASPSPLSSSSSSSLKVDLMKDENHRREISAMKKRLAESENTIRRLKMETLNLQGKSAPCRLDGSSCAEVRRLQAEIHALRTNNEKLEAKLRIAIDAEKARTAELRIQHENHEAELTALRKSLRSETIKMMDEMRGKSREIEKLSKLLIQGENSRKRRKTASKDDSMGQPENMISRSILSEWVVRRVMWAGI